MNKLQTTLFVVIGAGNIGKILLKRLLAAGVPPENLAVCESDAQRASAAASQFGVRLVSLSNETIGAADVLLVAAPPKAALSLIRTISGWLHPGQMVISFAAALPLTTLEALLPQSALVARVMPNAPSLVGKGMNPVAYGQAITPEARSLVEALLSCLGESIEVSDDLMNWCVGISGAAMRSLLPVLEGMIQAGLEAGMKAQDARKVATQVMLGTAALVQESNLPLDEIKALTPMQTVNETEVAQIFLQAARSAKEKSDQAQARLMEDKVSK